MDHERAGDVLLGATIGSVPIGLVATGRAHLVLGGLDPTAAGGLGTALAAVVTLCGLVLVVAGITVARYGHTTSRTTGLY